ncbi:barstar family protein [Kitasatospora sp. DSM 101779]|uniref:barstar family protein n=1 Tax=Kitasatospora sp. DSM 101779 TaxID=2853165 RepID=UPI0021DA5531|nr:barstar family protein [Kitasatospora sp. DSM 101779]
MAGSADLAILDATGVAMGSYVVNEVTVVDVRPSAHGAGLVDLVVTLWCDSAMPGADGVWELIRTGRLDRTGLWRELAPQDRRAWLSVALLSHEYRRRGRADTPAGRVVTLDGRHIEDRDSFFCAMGEAVNGPGGYWGWNLDALVDCLRGRWGATPPFTLQWADSAGARARLVEQVPTDGGPVLLFDLLVDILEERGTHVLLQ